jgi:hypothetical protein
MSYTSDTYPLTTIGTLLWVWPSPKRLPSLCNSTSLHTPEYLWPHVLHVIETAPKGTRLDHDETRLSRCVAGWSHDTGMLHLWQHDHLCDVSPTNGHIATQLPAFQRQPYVKSYILTTTLRQRLQPPARRGRPVLECYESFHGSSERLTRARAHASTTTGVSA